MRIAPLRTLLSLDQPRNQGQMRSGAQKSGSHHGRPRISLMKPCRGESDIYVLSDNRTLQTCRPEAFHQPTTPASMYAAHYKPI